VVRGQLQWPIRIKESNRKTEVWVKTEDILKALTYLDHDGNKIQKVIQKRLEI
jgi:hypothetical protein